MPFDTTAAKQAAADLAAAEAAEASAQMWSMIRTGGIAAGIVLVILAGLAALAPPQEVEEDYEPLELSDDMLAELDRLRISSIREEPSPGRPPGQSSRPPSGRRSEGRSPTMVSERPDEVAAMLRGWLSESKSVSDRRARRAARRA